MTDKTSKTMVAKDTTLQVIGIGALTTGLAQLQAGGDSTVGIAVALIGVAVLGLYTITYIKRE